MHELMKNTVRFKQIFLGLVPLHIFGLYSIYNIFSNNAASWWWVATIIGWILIKFFGIGAGYHRLFAHKGFEVNKFIKRFMLYWGSLGLQGSAILWTAIHRGEHHRHSDTDQDPHSPKDGFWHSYIWWMFTLKEGSVNVKKVPDLLRDPDMIFAHKYYYSVIWITWIVSALISVDLFLYLFILPALITLHVFCLQTSIVHYPKLGYKNYNTKDDSVNVPWLFFLTQGECWHNNHHGDPKNPNYGSRRWWELDPTYWIIKLVRSS